MPACELLMNAKPITVAFVLASLVSGCSSLPGGSAQYMSLPRAGVDLSAIPIAEDDEVDTVARQTGFPRSAATTARRQRVAGIDPLVVLRAQASVQPVMPKAARVKLARATGLTDPSTTATLSDGRSVGLHPVAPGIQEYNREATMERLFARGKKAVLPICEGC